MLVGVKDPVPLRVPVTDRVAVWLLLGVTELLKDPVPVTLLVFEGLCVEVCVEVLDGVCVIVCEGVGVALRVGVELCVIVCVGVCVALRVVVAVAVAAADCDPMLLAL